MSDEQTQAVAVREDVVPAFAIPIGEAQRRISELQQFVKGQMVKDTDYGVIPGTGDKPTLLKPGAEKLAMMYGFAIDVEVTQRVEDWDRGFFSYECTAHLINKRSGVVEAAGVGSCNSKEGRYRWRFAFEDQLPDGIDKSQLHKVTRKSRKTGKPYTQYRLENDDPFSLVNTILKMAKKRAVVDAVLSATRSSGLFTQDTEDTPPTGFSSPDKEPPRAQADSVRPPSPNSKATDEEKEGLINLAAEVGLDKAALVRWMADEFSVPDPKKMLRKQAQAVRDALDAMKREQEGGADSGDREAGDDLPWGGSPKQGEIADEGPGA